MAFSNACTLLGRCVLFRNAIKSVDNSRRAAICFPPKYSTATTTTTTRTPTIDTASIFDEIEDTPKKKMSKAMIAYLERAKEYSEFIQKERREYQIGKRHLANMMGENPETFTQNDVNKAIEYLFPSGLYDRKARPIMEEPEIIFPPRKEAQFDESGRPFHSMFYTLKPNFYEALYDLVEQFEKLDKIEDDELNKGLLPNVADKINLIGTEWISQEGLQNRFLEPMNENYYSDFITAIQRLADHPYSEKAKDFIMQFLVIKKEQIEKLIVLPLEYDNDGRPFVLVKDCKRKSAQAIVKVLGSGTGKISINGKDITYFKRLQHREQVIFPLIFTGMDNKVDIEATAESGGPTGQAGAIRWGISWGLRSFVEPEMIEKMRIAGLLTIDWRRRERKKPGQEGARRKFTWKKR